VLQPKNGINRYMFVAYHHNAEQNRNKSSKKMWQNEYILKWQEQIENCMDEEIKCRLNWGILATTQFRIFCLAICYLKHEDKSIQSYNCICGFLLMWNFVFHKGNNMDVGILRTGCWGEYLDLRGRRKQKARKKLHKELQSFIRLPHTEPKLNQQNHKANMCIVTAC
jgi:hypothetical protein